MNENKKQNNKNQKTQKTQPVKLIQENDKTKPEALKNPSISHHTSNSDNNTNLVSRPEPDESIPKPTEDSKPSTERPKPIEYPSTTIKADIKDDK